MNIAKVARKYSFKSIEIWALDVIQELIGRRPFPLLDAILIGFPFSTNPPPSTFAESNCQIYRSVQLAQMCGHANLLETMITLLRQLMPVSLHFSYLTMSLAGRSESQGAAGSGILGSSAKICVCGRNEDGNDLVEGDVHGSSDGLDRLVVGGPAQQLRLLSGCRRLSGAWEKLRATYLSSMHLLVELLGISTVAPRAGRSSGRKKKTRGDGVLVLDAANVMGKLQVILKEFDEWGSATYMHHECKSVARRAIWQDVVKHIRDSLPDFSHEVGEY